MEKLTVEQLRRLIATRQILRKLLNGPNPEREILAWCNRGGTAEVIQIAGYRDAKQVGRSSAAAFPPAQ